LGVHHSSIFRWIKVFEKEIEVPKKPLNSKEVEIDEMHSFVKIKKNRHNLDLDRDLQSLKNDFRL